MIIIDTPTNIKEYSNTIVIDLTQTRNKLSPFYPHGDIPILNTPNLCSNSVNEVWQKLCVNKKSIELSPKNVIFRKGVGINEYWTYEEARSMILVPTYRWMLENKAFDIVCKLREYNNQGRTLVFIDKTTNMDFADTSQPLSFAFLLKAYIECTSPYEDAMEEYDVHRYVMVGNKEYSTIIKDKRPRCISINTDAQRYFDF